MRKDAGFTLLEMIVATAVFSMVALTASMGFYAVYSSWSRLQIRSQGLDRLLAIDRVVDSAFRNAIPFWWPCETYTPPKAQPIFSGFREKMTLAYMHRVGDPVDGAIRFLTLSLDNENRLVAEYRKTPITAWNQDETGLTKDILAEKVASISFLYADRVTNKLDPAATFEWKDIWDTENKNFPVAIQMTIQWLDGTKESWLRRTAGAGYHESFGKGQETSSSTTQSSSGDSSSDDSSSSE